MADTYQADSDTVPYVTLALVSELMIEVLTLKQQVRIMEAKLILPKNSDMETVSKYVDQQEGGLNQIHDIMIDRVTKKVAEMTDAIKKQIR
jgi:hypothetical protein